MIKETESNESVLVPMGKWHGTYFRGQSVYYDSCRPSLYREDTEEKRLLSNLQFQEFKLLLESHPVINDLMFNTLRHREIKAPIKLSINYEGLAQHYGISTNLLDFTNDKWTSAFFATTSYDAVNDIYSPIDESQQLYGVFYIYTDDSELNSYKMEPIGLNF